MSTCTAIPSTGVSSAGFPGRDRDEPDVAAGHAPELGDEPVQVPPAVQDDVPSDGVDEPADRARVGQRPGREHPARQAGEERLLAGDTVQVPALEAVALPDEGERVGAADGLRARGEVDPGPDLVLGPLEAHRHPTDRLGHLDEPGEVDLRVVVDRELGELLDGRDQRAATGVAGPPVELGTGDPLGLESGLRVVGGPPVRRVDLVAARSSARATKESRGIEIATARAFGPAGTCSRMIVSVCSWPSSSPARSSASSSGGSGLPDASVRLSNPTRSAVNGCSGAGATVRLVMTSLVTTRSVSVRWTIQPYPVPISKASDSIAATRAPDRARDHAQQAGDSAHRTPLAALAHRHPVPDGPPAQEGATGLPGIVARRPGRAPHERRRAVPPRRATRHPDTARPCPTSRGRWSPHHDRPTRTPMSITVG